MFLAWGVLMPVAALVAAYERATIQKHWFRVHVALASLAALLSVIALILIILSTNRHFDEFHNVLKKILYLL